MGSWIISGRSGVHCCDCVQTRMMDRKALKRAEVETVCEKLRWQRRKGVKDSESSNSSIKAGILML